MISKPEHYGILTKRALWVFKDTTSSDGFKKSPRMIRDGKYGKKNIRIQKY